MPFLKIDKGLADEEDGAQMMKPMPDLDDLLDRAVANGVFGTKMRSVIKLPGAGHRRGRRAAVRGRASRSWRRASCRSSSPRSTSTARDKAEAEDQLKAAILDAAEPLGDDQQVMLKLTLPDTDNLYAELVEHPKVVRVVALSGGYSRDEACEKLARNHGVIASFSRALTEGLTAQQSDEEFNATLDAAIAEIAKASAT